MTITSRDPLRLVPTVKPEPALQEFIDACRARGWPLVGMVDADDQSGMPLVLTFETAPLAANAEFVWETAAHVPHVGVWGEDGVEAARALETDLSLLTVEAGALAYDLADTPEAQAHALLRLAVGAPLRRHPKVLARVMAGLHDPNAWVRSAALFGLRFRPWAAYREPVTVVATNDPELVLRRDAQDVLDVWPEIVIEEGA